MLIIKAPVKRNYCLGTPSSAWHSSKELILLFRVQAASVLSAEILNWKTHSTTEVPRTERTRWSTMAALPRIPVTAHLSSQTAHPHPTLSSRINLCLTLKMLLQRNLHRIRSTFISMSSDGSWFS